MHFSTLFVVHLIFLIKYQQTRADRRPYDVEIRSFEPNTMGTGIFEPKTLRVNRKGRNEYVLTGDFTLNMNLGEDSMLVYEIFKKLDVNNKYMSVLKGGGNICKFCATNTNFYPRFQTFTNFPDANTCPFPKGNYTIKDYTFDDQLLPANVPTGTYVVKTTFSKDNQNIFGVSTELFVSKG
ncbi:uncharacterized protein LOC119077643 [Bradysia coprophila]|uniref:uncharacterized protein LOC119077643 n=1 Tax=Bradysia coprophila TaxID=38358 RepID=UPI00187DA81F|nr:uncharacterized protein LOC119077643 [Bradysia coprophila]